MLKLTPENYHSPEARREYMSASRYKDYCGSLGIVPCEARAVAMDRGEWHEEPSEAMRVSSFVDAHFSGTLATFKSQNPDILTQKGELKAGYKHAETIIKRIESSEYMMKCLSGQKQVIMTAEFFGCKWSCMLDSHTPGVVNVDLKVMAKINKAHYVKDYGRMSFIEFYGYKEQAALYTKIVEINTGKRLPFLFACASKEEIPDIQVIGVTDQDINEALYQIERNMPRVLGLRSGELKPDSCGTCDHCRSVKVVDKPIHYSELILSI